MILCVGATPAAQRVMVFHHLVLNEVNRASSTLDGAAGKSINVAKVLQTLGERPVATGILGAGLGEEIRAALQSRGIESDFVRVNEPARQCITIIDEENHAVTELVQESRGIQPEAYGQLLAKVQTHLSHADALILSGSLTPGAPQDFYKRCVELAHAERVLATLDAQGRPLAQALDARPDLIKPNRYELGVTVGRDLGAESDVRTAMRQLNERGASRVVVTAGKEPAIAFDGNTFWKIYSPAIAAKNPIGSGDAFTAAVSWRTSLGDDLGEACRWGAAAGAANALTLMPGDLERGDVERLLAQSRAERVL